SLDLTACRRQDYKRSPRRSRRKSEVGFLFHLRVSFASFAVMLLAAHRPCLASSRSRSAVLRVWAMEIAHRTVDLGEVRLHCTEMGRGPLVLLLHGFPECWVSWRNQLPALAGAGFRAVAPDLRGYGRSDKPRGLDAYRVEVLARDVARLVEALGAERARVVGHDWGGAVAW